MSSFHEEIACWARKTTPEAVVSFVVMQKQRLEPCCPHAMSSLQGDKRLEKMETKLGLDPLLRSWIPSSDPLGLPGHHDEP